MTEPHTLAGATNASVCAPAGYGKTELIAKALMEGPDERHLILTHTHAGVHALRQRLQRLQVPSRRYHIDTIAGWALQYAKAYPKTASYTPPKDTITEDWPRIYNGVTVLLQTTPLHNILNASYHAAYVDEYQDCTKGQHQLITEVAKHIPCRVLGDPLQTIFDFAEPTVDWVTDVESTFSPLPALTTPHRWAHDPDFANWLHKLRRDFENDRPIALNYGVPQAVRVERTRANNDHGEALRRAVNRTRSNGTSAIITQWGPEAHYAAISTYGPRVIEPIDSNDFLKHAEAIVTTTGSERATAILELATACMTGYNQQTRDRLHGAACGTRRVRNTTHQVQIDALREAAEQNSLGATANALVTLVQMPSARLIRDELYYETRRALLLCMEERCPIEEAVARVRQRTRHLGRKLHTQTAGHTLLLKGLEFDHAIVLNPEKLNKKNLYVALTRGRKSLTIITKKSILTPK